MLRAQMWWTTRCQTYQISSSRLKQSRSQLSNHSRKASKAKVSRATARLLWTISKNLKLNCKMALTVKWLLSSSTHWQTWAVSIHSTMVLETGSRMVTTSSNNWFNLRPTQSLSRSPHRVKELKLSTSNQVHMPLVKSKRLATIEMEVARTMDHQLHTSLVKDRVSHTRISMSRWRVETLSNARPIKTTDSKILTMQSPMVHTVTIWSKMELTVCWSKCSKLMASLCWPRITVHWRETALNRDRSMDSQHRVTSTCLTQTLSARPWAYHSLATTCTMQWEAVLEEGILALLMVQLLRITLIIKAFWPSMTMMLMKWRMVLQCITIITPFNRLPT